MSDMERRRRGLSPVLAPQGLTPDAPPLPPPAAATATASAGPGAKQPSAPPSSGGGLSRASTLPPPTPGVLSLQVLKMPGTLQRATVRVPYPRGTVRDLKASCNEALAIAPGLHLRLICSGKVGSRVRAVARCCCCCSSCCSASQWLAQTEHCPIPSRPLTVVPCMYIH